MIVTERKVYKAGGRECLTGLKMNLIGKILRPLSLAVAVGYSSLVGCSKDEDKKPETSDDYAAGLKESEDLVALAEKKATPSTFVQPGVSTPATLVPTAPGASEPTAPVSPGPVTPVKPGVTDIPRISEPRTVRRPARASLKRVVSDLGYFSVTDPQNFISIGGHGSEDSYGGFAHGNLDGRLGFLRGDVFLGYSRSNSVREGEKDLISDLGIGRAGIELVLFDNKDVYFGLGPLVGGNYLESENTLGFEPKSLRAALAGGRVRGSVKGLLDVYGSGLQRVVGDYKSDAFGKRKKYDVRELTAGAKMHLGRGISLGGECGEIKEENEDLANIWKRRATGYVELKDIAGSGVSAWLMGSGYRFHARHNMDNDVLEARIRFLADLGSNFYLGGSVYGSRDKLSEKNKFGGEALVAYKFR